MKTEHLITALAADTAPGPRVGQRLILGLLPALLLSAVALLALWGTRGDLGAALLSPTVQKTLLPLALAAVALRVAQRLSRPDQQDLPGRRVLGLLVAAVAALFLATWAQSAWGALATALLESSLLVCLFSVTALSIVPLAGTLWALSAGASLSPARSGALAGLVAGGFAAALYSLYCTDDNPLFYIPAYGAAITAVTLAGRLLGARMLKW